MAFRNAEGMAISYESEDLIEDLKEDIEEFGGDKIVYAVTRQSHGVTLYVDYAIDKEEKAEIELQDGEDFKKMSATALLMLFEQQNSII